MSLESKFNTAHYSGNSFSIDGQNFYPLEAPKGFILTIDKVIDLNTDFACEALARLEEIIDEGCCDMWLSFNGEIVTIMSNADGIRLVKVRNRFKTDILLANSIYLKETA